MQVVRKSQTVVIGNKDPVGHNTNISASVGPINQTIASESTLDYQFQAAERIPVTVKCNIHPWMTAHFVVTDHPYATKTDVDGKFVLKNLPTGEEIAIQFWQERSGYVRNIDTGSHQISKKGRLKITLNGDGDLGEIQVPATLFN